MSLDRSAPLGVHPISHACRRAFPARRAVLRCARRPYPGSGRALPAARRAAQPDRAAALERASITSVWQIGQNAPTGTTGPSRRQVQTPPTSAAPMCAPASLLSALPRYPSSSDLRTAPQSAGEVRRPSPCFARDRRASVTGDARYRHSSRPRVHVRVIRPTASTDTSEARVGWRAFSNVEEGDPPILT
jgi:hypothetical protein